MGRKTVTNHFSFVYVGKPESYNANSKKKELYKKRLFSAYKRRFSGMMVDKELYASIYYFYKEDVGLEADNISKPAWDALNAVGYTDDKMIEIRAAVAINQCEYDIVDFDQDNLPSDVLVDLVQSVSDNCSYKGHYLYEGIGMRQLMDYYFTLLNLGESNHALAKKEIKELGLQKILSAVMYVMVVVFGLDEKYRLCDYDKELGEELLDDIMNCGNFGQYNSENNVENENRIHWAWRRLKRRFKLIRYDSASLQFRPIYRLRVALAKNCIERKYNVKKTTI